MFLTLCIKIMTVMVFSCSPLCWWQMKDKSNTTLYELWYICLYYLLCLCYLSLVVFAWLKIVLLCFYTHIDWGYLTRNLCYNVIKSIKWSAGKKRLWSDYNLSNIGIKANLCMSLLAEMKQNCFLIPNLKAVGQLWNWLLTHYIYGGLAWLCNIAVFLLQSVLSCLSPKHDYTS
jgi:hypothetical protein